jgi:hypothetical protein
LGGGAFLHVLDRPQRGEQVVRGTVEDRRGVAHDVRLTIMRSGFEQRGSGLPPKGPSRVERKVKGGQIAWFARRHARGEPLSPQGRRQFMPPRRVGDFARVIQPDPDDWIVDGIVSDDVARVVVFLSTGERRRAPLRDNVVIVRVSAAKFPARVVGYDAAGRVIDVLTIGGGPPGPRPAGPWRVVMRLEATAAHSGAVLRAARSSSGGSCMLVRFGSSESSRCFPRRWQRDGSTVRVRPRQSFVLVGVPSEIGRVVGLDARGRKLAARPFRGR